jgi:predicted ester cyclase/predicted SnoaL-like aldol condensation-catalyzing enzyme
MRLVRWVYTLVTPIFVMATSNSPPLCTSPRSPKYESLEANHSASFHANFDTGEAGKHANGDLVSNSLYWTANQVNTLGRTPFVNGLLSFGGPFPDLFIADLIHLNEGNKASIMFYFQGHQTGEFDGVPASGAAIQILNGELFVFDQDVLLDRLITVNELNILQLQITGQQKVTDFTNVTLIKNPQTPKAFRESLKSTTAKFHQNFNLNKTADNAAFVMDNVQIFSNKGLQTGKEAFLALFTQFETSHPDLLAHDEYLLADGHFTSLEWIWQGTFTGPFTLTNGTVVQPTKKSYRTQAMAWFQFNDQGLVEHVWHVSNRDDLVEIVQN